MIYLFLIIVEVIVNLKNKPEAVEKVGGMLRGTVGGSSGPTAHCDIRDSKRSPIACRCATWQVHLFCAVFFMLYMVAFTAITIW